ncbi:helix-turn-helix domain-containing protein [Halovenus sp. HT40]|uniref:helix-turn-helix domain-containing protein n=1 Tax=Halovenus sp. HT40 TaxID=3126691 RepID=UPI00300EA836
MGQCKQYDERVAGGGPETRLFRAKLVVQPDSTVECAALDSEADVVAHELKVPPSCQGDTAGDCDPATCGECHVELAGSSGGYIRTRPDAACICPVLKRHDCLTELEAVQSESLVVTVTAPRREVLFQLIGDLREIGSSVSISWLTSVDGDGETVEIDAEAITPTQRETLEAAIEAGYYTDGDGITLSELAADLNLSESAVSQRLNAAETRLVKAFLTEMG